MQDNYDINALQTFFRAIDLLVTNQIQSSGTLLSLLHSKNGRHCFLVTPDGTGKIFLVNIILAEICNLNKIALYMTAYGMASTLLAGLRTAFFTLQLLLNLQLSKQFVCNISKESGQAQGLNLCNLIV